jgi:hypothetical protein
MEVYRVGFTKFENLAAANVHFVLICSLSGSLAGRYEGFERTYVFLSLLQRRQCFTPKLRSVSFLLRRNP